MIELKRFASAEAYGTCITCETGCEGPLGGGQCPQGCSLRCDAGCTDGCSEVCVKFIGW